MRTSMHTPTEVRCTMQVEGEIDILQQAGSHPNLVEFHGWYRDAQGILCLVLGYCEGGSLDVLIRQKAAPSGKQQPVPLAAYFPEEQVMEWFVQMLSALNHLHSHRILHRYCPHIPFISYCMLKPNNSMIPSRGMRC